jgi:hypothetical protein
MKSKQCTPFAEPSELRDGEGAQFDIPQFDRFGDDADDLLLPFHFDPAEFVFELPDVGQPGSQSRRWRSFG